MHCVIYLIRPVSFAYSRIINSDLFSDNDHGYDDITYDNNGKNDKFIACILFGAERP